MVDVFIDNVVFLYVKEGFNFKLEIVDLFIGKIFDVVKFFWMVYGL